MLGSLSLLYLAGWVFSTQARGSLDSLWVAPESNILLKAVINGFNGNLYVGAKNAVFQFDANLTLRNTLTTGPLQAALDCFPPSWEKWSGSCFGSKTTEQKLDNYVQAMSFIPHYNLLLLCGNLEAGSCSLHSSRNVSRVFRNSAQFVEQALNQSQSLGDMLVVSRDTEANTAAIIAPDYKGKPSLYVATYFDRYTNFRPPTLSIRDLTPGKELFVTSKLSLPKWDQGTAESRVRFGFHSGQFVYFVSYQQGRTILSRICTNDAGMGSGTLNAYMEGSIQCGGSKYKFMTSQAIGKPSATLASWLNINATDDVVVATFASDFGATSDEPSGESAVCLFPAKFIERQFQAKQQDCVNGKGLKGIQREKEKSPCVNASAFWDNLSCSSKYFDMTLELDYPIVVTPIYETNNTAMVLSAVSVLNYDNKTALYVGAGNGIILELLIDPNKDSTYLFATATAVKNVNLGEKIIAAVPGTYKRHAYFMSTSKVAKIALEEADDDCSLYSDCQTCTQQSSCVYCVFQNRCARRREDCLSLGSQKFWIQSHVKCPQLEWFSPSNASFRQPTEVTLSVLNVPSESVVCAFGEEGEVAATFENKSQTFVCKSPRVQSVSTNTGTISVQLSLKYALTDVVIVKSSKNFLFYDCTVFRGCKTCTQSEMFCEWCSTSQRCMNKGQQECTAQSTCSISDSTERPVQKSATPTTFPTPALSSLTSVVPTSSKHLPDQTPESNHSRLIVILCVTIAVVVVALVAVTLLLLFIQYRSGKYSVNSSTPTAASTSRSQREGTSSIIFEDLHNPFHSSNGSSQLEMSELRDHVPEMPVFHTVGRRFGQVTRPRSESVASDGYQRPADVINQLRRNQKESVAEDGYDKLGFHLKNMSY